MSKIESLLAMYLFTLPLAVAAAYWGLAQLKRREPPAGPMRTMQLGVPVTEPAAKLALARQYGWMALTFAAAMVIGPLLTIRMSHE